MPKKRYSFIVLILLIIPFLTAQYSKQETTPLGKKAANPYIGQFVDDYDQYVSKAVEKGQAPGAAVAIIEGNVVHLCKGYGVKNIEKGDSVDSHTVFRIGSNSKGFAAVLTAILVEDSLLSWEDPVNNFLPDFAVRPRNVSKKITIRHLLSHTTGLPHHAYTNLIDDGRHNLSQMIDRLKSVKLFAEPGEYYSYQNLAYSIIDPLLTEVTGDSFNDLLEKNIFIPLDMQNASASFEEINENKNIALPHYRYRGRWNVSRISKTYYDVVPAGGINASISDMAKWLSALMGNHPDLLSKSTIDQVFEAQIATPVRYRYFSRWPEVGKSYYGMGWRIVETGGDILIYHGGYVNGYRSEVAIFPKYQMGVCILTNSPSSLANSGIPKFIEIFRKHEKDIRTWDEQLITFGESLNY